nr:MAG TPA: hypothetical protein [Caudoviricetes sp.]
MAGDHLGRANAFHSHRVFYVPLNVIGRDPCLFGSVRGIFLSGYAAPFAYCQLWHG